MDRSGFTLVELVIVILILSVLCALLIPSILWARESRRHTICQNNLKQFGLVFRMYSGEAINELYPRPGRGLADIDGPALYPEYLSDEKCLVCPSN